MHKKLKKGWLLEITSWENDGDFRSTESLNFPEQDRSKLAWLLYIIPYFQKSSWEKGPNGEEGYYVGNCYEDLDYDRLRQIMKEAFALHWQDEEYHLEFPDDFEPMELLYDFGNIFVGMQDGQQTRKIDSYRLYEVPVDLEMVEIKWQNTL